MPIRELFRRYVLYPSAATRAAWLAVLFASPVIVALLAAILVPILLRNLSAPPPR